MKSPISLASAAIARPKVTLMMVLCGIVGTAAAGVVSASTAEDDVPSIIVKYDPQSLETDAGARAVYFRLTKAAEQVCPDAPRGTRSINAVTQQCRAQAVARAVQKINNARLAAVDTVRAKRG
jgi:UrcA family protein